jgi:hypothetical protein
LIGLEPWQVFCLQFLTACLALPTKPSISIVLQPCPSQFSKILPRLTLYLVCSPVSSSKSTRKTAFVLVFEHSLYGEDLVWPRPHHRRLGSEGVRPRSRGLLALRLPNKPGKIEFLQIAMSSLCVQYCNHDNLSNGLSTT